MNEKEILEYRQKSAEKLGFRLKKDVWDGNDEYWSNDKLVCYVLEWQPDKDANQMLMVKNHISKQGIDIVIASSWIWNKAPNSAKWELYYSCSFGEKHNGNILSYYSTTESEFIAFAKAFLEYDKQQ